MFPSKPPEKITISLFFLCYQGPTKWDIDLKWANDYEMYIDV